MLFAVLTLWWEMVFTLAPHTTTYMRDIRADLIEKTLGESGFLSRYTTYKHSKRNYICMNPVYHLEN